MRNFTKTSLALAAALLLGSITTSTLAREGNSFVASETVQSMQAPALAADNDLLARNKPRVPGGSGCDDPDDLIEHPECRPGNAVLKDEQQARNSIAQDVIVAREASEGPRGADRPGEDNGGRHGGRG
jgi:hypothetical protein